LLAACQRAGARSAPQLARLAGLFGVPVPMACVQLQAAHVAH